MTQLSSTFLSPSLCPNCLQQSKHIPSHPRPSLWPQEALLFTEGPCLPCLSYPTLNPSYRDIWEKPPGPRVPARACGGFGATKNKTQ